MVNNRRFWATLVMGFAIMGLAYSAFGESDKSDNGSSWLATGTISKVDGPVFYLLGKNNYVYDIRAAETQFIVDDESGAKYTPKVGDNVRVYGKVIEGSKIEASRVRLLNGESRPAAPASGPQKEIPQKEIHIIIQTPLTQPGQTTQSVENVCPPDWEGRGLVMDIDYIGRTLKVRTSTGTFTVCTEKAQLLHGSKRIGLGLLNTGDAVKIVGNAAGPNQIVAQQVSVMITRDDAQNAVPQFPVSLVGVIQTVDQPSMTFKMQTESATLNVLADKDTVLQNEMKTAAFSDLKPGMRVKMSGYGNLANGYVAQHIQIISLSP